MKTYTEIVAAKETLAAAIPGAKIDIVQVSGDTSATMPSVGCDPTARYRLKVAVPVGEGRWKAMTYPAAD